MRRFEVKPMRKLCCLLSCLLPAVGVSAAMARTAQAAEVTRVASSFEDDDVFDLHFGVTYDYQFKRAAVLREWNTGTPTDDRTQLVKDLIYRQQRHTLTPTLEIGLWHDLAIYASLPVVLADIRDYSFDKRADDCSFGNEAPATCVDKDNSTTLRDEIVPYNGFDATNTANPFRQFTGPGTDLIFKAPNRRGLDQIHVGIKYGILNEEKRTHMPNWVVGLEGRFAVGRAMTFSRDITVDDPSGNHRVGRRVHELGLWTSLSRRYRFLDPFFTAYWRQSIRASGSQFTDFSSLGAQGSRAPQSQAGITVGGEIVPWERKAKNLKVSILLQGSAELHYGGRAYSEVWELLADSPAMVGANDPARAGDCDRNQALAFARENPGDPGYVAAGGSSCERFGGVTNLQDYGTFGFRGGLNLHLSKYVRVALGANVSTDTRHFLTAANRGDANAVGGGDPDRVDPNTAEVNPVRRDVVDNVGRRYVVDDVISTMGYLQILLTF
jgi:hypothetical protein